MDLKCRTDEKELDIVLTITSKYCKTIYKSETECLICMDEGQPEWHQYQLSCGHKFHTRCFREWMRHTDKVKCSYCGDAVVLKAYCRECDEFKNHYHF